jgi:hypothetical protein
MTETLSADALINLEATPLQNIPITMKLGPLPKNGDALRVNQEIDIRITGENSLLAKIVVVTQPEHDRSHWVILGKYLSGRLLVSENSTIEIRYNSKKKIASISLAKR